MQTLSVNIWFDDVQIQYVRRIIKVSECLLFNANSAIFQLYHGGNKLIFNEKMMGSAFILNQHDKLFFYSASALKQQSADRHVASLGYIILIPSQPIFALSP